MSLFVINFYVTVNLCQMYKKQIEMNEIFVTSINEIGNGLEDQAKHLLSVNDVVANFVSKYSSALQILEY
ncbi:Oidioi.mRNA.OKI2018_I69.chr2.g6976.t1.cds [Oikopleura dioica]|uniref:Oidioi.mRNA.OKI2018_I69.chr2.g6976.t1.cds n=1 Tax=Oikopleura dioica TaxID=34765 RepID=A0ABN7T8G7_OIKDI|nr:Oidioi.mRNA.OKI2018_I69.chr2.g6976.t1.cds [Oikopleura dioica]